MIQKVRPKEKVKNNNILIGKLFVRKERYLNQFPHFLISLIFALFRDQLLQEAEGLGGRKENEEKPYGIF